MANTVNAAYLESLQNPTHDWRVAVLGVGYTYSAAHTRFSDLTDVLDNIVLSGVTNTNGVLDANDVTIASGVILAAIKALWVYDNSIGGSSPQLYVYNDTGLNFGSTPTGQVIIQWPNVTGVNINPLAGLP